MQVDYSDTHLSDEEVKRYMERERREKELERLQTKQRLSKHTHFKGGMIW